MFDLEKQSPPPSTKLSLDCTLPSCSTTASLCATSPPPSRRPAFLAVFGSFLALFCSFGQMSSFGTFQPWYSTHQLSHMSDYDISWIGSLQFSAFFFMGGPVGFLFDIWGPTPLLITGTLLGILSLVFTSISTQYYQYLLAHGVLFGLSVALLFYPSISATSTFFNEYRATAIGIAAAGSGLGGVIYPILLRALFTAVGFSWALRISALLTAILGIAAILTVSTGNRRKQLPISLKDIRFTCDKQFVLLVIGSSFVCFGFFVPYIYISSYAIHLKLPPDMGFYVLSIMNGGSVIGRVAPAWLSDKIGRFNLLCPTAFLSGLFCLLLWSFAHNLGALATFAGIYGFLSGAFVSVVMPCVAQISEMSEIGTRIGALYTLVSIPSLTGGPVAGLMLRDGSYIGAIVLTGCSMIVGSGFILASKLSIDPRLFHRV